VPKSALSIVAIVAAIAGSIFFYTSQSNRPPVEPVIETVSVEPAQSGPIHVEFELDGLDGESRQFAEWDGKHRVVNFWATWCAPCRREIPLLKAFQDKHGPDGFQVIGIAVEFPEPVIAYAESAEFNYPILVGEQDAMAVAESSGISFIGLPFTMIVTKQGTLVGAHMGEIHQEHLDRIVIVLNRLDAGEIDLSAAKKSLSLL
jgi:thiol-disulfide isomerase/thioredoxin